MFFQDRRSKAQSREQDIGKRQNKLPPQRHRDRLADDNKLTPDYKTDGEPQSDSDLTADLPDRGPSKSPRDRPSDKDAEAITLFQASLKNYPVSGNPNPFVLLLLRSPAQIWIGSVFRVPPSPACMGRTG